MVKQLGSRRDGFEPKAHIHNHPSKIEGKKS